MDGRVAITNKESVSLFFMRYRLRLGYIQINGSRIFPDDRARISESDIATMYDPEPTWSGECAATNGIVVVGAGDLTLPGVAHRMEVGIWMGAIEYALLQRQNAPGHLCDSIEKPFRRGNSC